MLGYVLMHATFVRLFLNMRRMGSNFWLPGMVLVSSCFAFLTALLSASILNIPVDPICLSEALPFLVITVGFDKPFTLAKAVFTSPEIAPVLLRRKPVIEPGSSSELADKPKEKVGVQWAPPVPATQIVVNAVQRVGASIVRDFALEVVVLMIGAASGVGGLKEFCKLAALIVIADCCFLFSFYVAILTIMVEIHRIKLIRGLRPINHRTPTTSVPATPIGGKSSTDATNGVVHANGNGNGNGHHASHPSASPSLYKKVSTALFGGGEEKDLSTGGVKENPVARLKLLLVSFSLIYCPHR